MSEEITMSKKIFFCMNCQFYHTADDGCLTPRGESVRTIPKSPPLSFKCSIHKWESNDPCPECKPHPVISVSEEAGVWAKKLIADARSISDQNLLDDKSEEACLQFVEDTYAKYIQLAISSATEKLTKETDKAPTFVTRFGSLEARIYRLVQVAIDWERRMDKYEKLTKENEELRQLNSHILVRSYPLKEQVESVCIKRDELETENQTLSARVRELEAEVLKLNSKVGFAEGCLIAIDWWEVPSELKKKLQDALVQLQQ